MTQWTKAIQRSRTRTFSTLPANAFGTRYSPTGTHQGTPWTGQKDKLGVTWTGAEAELKAMERDFSKVADWAKQNNRPIYIGVFGTYEKAEMPSRIAWVVRDHDPRRALSGLLAVQVHTGPPMKVQFKNLRIRQFQPKPDQRSQNPPKGGIPAQT